MLFLVICFVFCFQGTSQTQVINPLNLNPNGQHVCSRETQQTERYTTTKATVVYSRYTTCCGWFCLSRCARTRTRIEYRPIEKTRIVTVKIVHCCSGWQQASSTSTECAKAICLQGCTSHGVCNKPNYCLCYPGWTGSNCASEINECSSNNGFCDQVCYNTHGSYGCACNQGYIKTGFYGCTDIDECNEDPIPCICGVSDERCGVSCTNTAGSFTCSCTEGFQLKSGSRTVCVDINECLTSNGGCSQRCNNSPGSFTCGCYSGFLLNTSDRSSCEDINECLSSNGFCSHQCVNTVGSYFCRCDPGFYLDSNGRTCSDHDECLTNLHGCHHKCNNFQGGFYCSCYAGYALKKDNKTCSDVNECTAVYVASLNTTIIPAGCDQLCHNTEGNYTCSCNHGYRLLYDGKRCRDVDECKAGTHSCEHICHNTPGSYGCSCFQGYQLKPDLSSCEGLPCENIMSPPNGRMVCSGLVTNETCLFTCNDGYALRGSERRTCLSSSEWDGQQTFCHVKNCGRLVPPEKGKVFLPCYFTFGSICRLGCVDGYVAVGNNFATCLVTNSSEVWWDIGNFTCKEIILCKPNPCRHDGKCIIINSRQFSCNCQNTGYEGDLCQRGVVILPDFPKLIAGNPSKRLLLRANPDNSLTFRINSSMNLAIEPDKLTIQHPASKAELQVMGRNSGVGTVMYNLEGVDKHEFTVPDTSFVFIGRTVSSQNSIYTRLGLLVGELPIGCEKQEIQSEVKNYKACEIGVTATTNSTKSNGTVIESGPVHIITSDNKTIPLSLAGYNFSSLHPSRKEIMERLTMLTNVNHQRQTGDQKPSAHGCSDTQLTAGDLMEFIQKDALPKSFIRYFRDHLPLWLKVKVREDSNLFDIENILTNLVQTTDARTIHPICKIPNDLQSVVVLYRPTVNYSISVDNNHIFLSSKGSCFATDICETGAFLTFSQEARNKVATMPFMRNMANEGWELSVFSFGFTTPRRYNMIANSVPDGHLVEDFSNFHYNLWWQGSANIHLNDAGYAVNMKMTGEAFAFVKDLNAVFTTYFSQAMTCVFSGSVEFNITLQALGQRFALTFYVSEVIGKAKFGGTAFLTPEFPDDCRVPQGFVFALEKSSKPFSSSPLSNIIRPNNGLKYLQIYHSITGGQDFSAKDSKNNLLLVELLTQKIKQFLLKVKTTVPELQSDTERWELVAEEMLNTVSHARRLLSLTSNWLHLKVLVEKLDSHLDLITRALDLFVAQLHPFKNRTNIETFISDFINLKENLPNTISLSFIKSSIQQKFSGLRFHLVGQVCHKRLCFSNIKLSIWFLHGNQCSTSPARQEAGSLVEGTALQSISLGSLITFPAGGTLRVFLARHSDLTLTTFESLINLLGLTKNATVRLTGNELSFVIWGPLFGALDALLNVKAKVENIKNWNSIVFAVEGTMNRSSRFHKLLENMITNETTILAKEAKQRLAKAEAAFNTAKKKLDLANNVTKSKQATAEDLKIKKERASHRLREARLRYNQTKLEFNRIYYNVQNFSSVVCDIQDCNYTCVNFGCAIPDVCQDAKEIKFIEQRCDTVEETITVEKVQSRKERRSFTVKTSRVIYTGNCREDIPAVIAAAGIGFVVAGPAGAAFGAGIARFSKSIFGCDETYEKVPGEPRIVEYYEKIFEKKAVPVTIKRFQCTGQTEMTKPGGYGPPYQCCRQSGCQTKVIDSQCIVSNKECEDSMTRLNLHLSTQNEALRHEFELLKDYADEVKKATFSFEKARVRHASAVTTLKQVEAYMKQQLSVVNIANASMIHFPQIVDLGLKIAQAMNASENKKVVDVDEMKFFLSVASEEARQVVVHSNASTVTGKRTPVSFLLDFNQVERSISSASKAIIAKLFAYNHSRRKRSTREAVSSHSSFTDYPYACLFVSKTRIYMENMFESLGDLITSFRRLNLNLSSGFQELERLAQLVNASGSRSNTSSVNASSGYPNSSFVTEYVEMIQVLKNENIKLSNYSSQSWNDTLEAWRAFLEVFTSAQEFEECSGTQDCIEHVFEGAKEFYEFEDSPRALEIKDALPQLKEVINLLTTKALSILGAEQALNQAAYLLNKTRDDSVLCGGTPHIKSSSQGEVILFPGDSLTLNCSAKKEEGLTYAWRRNDALIAKSVNGTFYVGDVTKDNEGAYVCVVSNNKGSSFSNVTIIKVHSKPKITQHPQSQRVIFRSQMPATFICNATAEPSPTFQWFFQSTNSSTVKLNETRPVLYFANPHLHQEGYYHCEASNDHGVAVSQRARLDVLNYSVGLPRFLIAFNLTTQCWLLLNSSNSSAQNPPPCESESINVLPSSLHGNLTGILLHSLARSLNVSFELISQLEYYSRNASKSSVVFILDVHNEPWKQDNFKSYIEIVEALVVAKAHMVDKLKQLNSDIFNKTFKVPWNNTFLLGEPGSILVYSLFPRCPAGQSLSGNGFICANCPAGSFYDTENSTCVECPLATYQPAQGQKECISCGKTFTTTFNRTIEKSDCIADCPAGSYKTMNRTCILCPRGTYQPSTGWPYCISCGQNLTTTSTGTVHKMLCIADCRAGSYSTLKNRTCILCPHATYQPLTGRLSCISCGQNLTTTSSGTVNKTQCIANCSAGLYYSTEKDKCVECPLGTYQPIQGQEECVSCGKNLTTVSNGTAKESDCIADCPAGSYSTLKNRTCILCPRGTYQPSTGRLSCISCGQNFTTFLSGTVDKMHCIKTETPTSDIPSTSEAQSTVTASPSASPTRILELKLFFKGKLLSSGMKRNKKQILDLIEEKVSRFLGTVVVAEKKSGMSITEYGAKVVLFINAAGVDERRLQELLSEGIKIDYHGKKMHFTGIMTTFAPADVSVPTNDAGKIKEQEGAEKMQWKLPAIIAGPFLVVLIVGVACFVLFCKRRKVKKSKQPAASTIFQFDNPTYAASQKPPEIKRNVYSTSQFDNLAYTASEVPPEVREDEYSSVDNSLFNNADDHIHDTIMQPPLVCAPGITKQAKIIRQ